MSFNKIGDDGAKDLAEALKVNTALTKLYLDGNKIGDNGAKDLAEALKVNTALTELHFISNKIGDDGAKDLAKALKVNTALTELVLYGNKIGDDGAKDLAKALKVNTALTNLNLDDNKIGGEGVKHLAAVLATASNSHKIYLGYQIAEAKNLLDIKKDGCVPANKIKQYLLTIFNDPCNKEESVESKLKYDFSKCTEILLQDVCGAEKWIKTDPFDESVYTHDQICSNFYTCSSGDSSLIITQPHDHIYLHADL